MAGQGGTETRTDTGEGGEAGETPRLPELMEWFAAGEKPREAWRVGGEHETFGVGPGHRPLAYEPAKPGEPSVLGVLEGLRERLGWAPIRERGRIIGLQDATRRGGAAVTLEPGGQIELSGSPHETVFQVVEEFSAWARELGHVADAARVGWMWTGYRPVFAFEDLDLMPKARYEIMQRYLPTRGRLALHMMQSTATVQANLDYADEGDMARKTRAAMGISSTVTAMFANSPFRDGAPSGFKSTRARIWQEVDPDRTGLLPFAFDGEGMTYERYARWALDVPLFFLIRDGRYIDCAGLPFRTFLERGHGGYRATLADWETHLSTLFPEVRLKRYLETRGADCVAPHMLPASWALWRGLLYDGTALDATWDLTRRWAFSGRQQHLRDVARLGLDATAPDGHRTADLARELLDIARHGLDALHREAEARGGRPGAPSDAMSDAVFLEGIAPLTRAGQCPADRCLAWYAETRPTPAELMDHYVRAWPTEPQELVKFLACD